MHVPKQPRRTPTPFPAITQAVLLDAPACAEQHHFGCGCPRDVFSADADALLAYLEGLRAGDERPCSGCGEPAVDGTCDRCLVRWEAA